MNKFELELLKRAGDEIQRLRTDNQLKAVRLQMFDDCLQLVRVQTYEINRTMSAGVDVLGEIRMVISTEEKKLPPDGAESK